MLVSGWGRKGSDLKTSKISIFVGSLGCKCQLSSNVIYNLKMLGAIKFGDATGRFLRTPKM